MNKTLSLLLFIGLGSLNVVPVSLAASKDSNAYQMALLQAKNDNPQAVMMHKSIEPPQSIVSEFEWILQSLQNRCIEPEPVITNVIVKTWSITQNKGANLSLISIARSLSQLTQNTNLFGQGKVPIQKVAEYWLAKYFLPSLKK